MANPVIALRVPQDLRDKIDQRAKAEGKTSSELIRDLLTESFPDPPRTGPALTNPRTKLRTPRQP